MSRPNLYNDRYQAELAAQNAMQAAAKTLAATPDGTNSITGKDTFLVVRADSGQGTPASLITLPNPLLEVVQR